MMLDDDQKKMLAKSCIFAILFATIMAQTYVTWTLPGVTMADIYFAAAFFFLASWGIGYIFLDKARRIRQPRSGNIALIGMVTIPASLYVIMVCFGAWVGVFAVLAFMIAVWIDVKTWQI